MKDHLSIYVASQRLLEELCEHGEYDTAKVVLRAVTQYCDRSQQNNLLKLLQSGTEETRGKLETALEMLGVQQCGELTPGCNLTPSDILSARRDNWVVSVVTSIVPTQVHAHSAGGGNNFDWCADFYDGCWRLFRYSYGRKVLVDRAFITLRAAISYAIAYPRAVNCR